MSHVRKHPKHIQRQVVDPTAIPDIAGVTGVNTIAALPSPPAGPIAVDPNAPTTFNGGAPLVPTEPTITTGTSTLSATLTPTPTGSDTADVNSMSASSASKLPIGTVVAACVGALVGAVVLITIFLWWLKRTPPKRPRTANAHGREAQRQARGLSWNRLGDDEDRWEGSTAVSGAKVEMSQTQTEADEKNFSMFKKTNSMRTTRTARALEEHGIDLPAFEFSQYHPNLAAELSLEQPDKPFAASRQNSTQSWDRDTVGDDSFLSLRSVRVESGTMSPTVAQKMTPQATSTVSSLHKWESAEVVHMTDDVSQPASNPFADVYEERSSGDNPFFGGAQDMRRTASRRSRSNSRGSRHSRNTSRASRSRPQSRVRPESEANPVDPFTDEGLPAGIPPFVPHHAQSDSVASGASGSAFATEQAMKHLIAALNLTPEEVEARLRVASMQASTLSRYSGISGVSSNVHDDEDDVTTLRGFPIPPSPLTPNSSHAR